jgi:hypothetical protein
MNGIVVGCDRQQEWMLCWWWGHYVEQNTLPVAFIDMGMSKEAVAWCRERGECIPLPAIPYRTPKKRALWQECYGPGIWGVRPAWLKKPHALLHSPFDVGLWLDMDCEVKGSLDPIFHLMALGGEIALAQDAYKGLMQWPGEVNYNAGVIAFRKNAPILSQWVEALSQHELPGDQEYLCRAIHLNQTEVMEIPRVYNWVSALGCPDEDVVIRHHSGGAAKAALVEVILNRGG